MRACACMYICVNVRVFKRVHVRIAVYRGVYSMCTNRVPTFSLGEQASHTLWPHRKAMVFSRSRHTGHVMRSARADGEGGRPESVEDLVGGGGRLM